jgi:nucleoside-diphosphate-sugar epimerase
MRVFVAGASGAIGRPLLPQLVAAGHEVTGTTRSEERAEAIRDAGARAVICDALDAETLHAAVSEARPEVVVHELTALPHRFNPRDKQMYAPTNRVRREGTRHLIAAAQVAGARRIVCQSIAFAYAPGQRPEVKEEDAPLALEAPLPFGDSVRAIDEMERAVVGAAGLEGLVLRYGWFYGPGTYFADDGSVARDVRRRRLPVIGKGIGLYSFVHVDDAASATSRRSSAERRAYTTSWTTTRRPSASGCRSTPRPSARRSRCACPSGSRGWRWGRSRRWLTCRRAPRTRKRSRSSAGSRAGPAGARASAKRRAERHTIRTAPAVLA